MEQKLYAPKSNHYSLIGASMRPGTLTTELIAENLYRMWLQEEKDMDPMEALEKAQNEGAPVAFGSEAYSTEVETYLMESKQEMDEELEEITDEEEKESIIDNLWTIPYREFMEQQHVEWD